VSVIGSELTSLETGADVVSTASELDEESDETGSAVLAVGLDESLVKLDDDESVLEEAPELGSSPPVADGIELSLPLNSGEILSVGSELESEELSVSDGLGDITSITGCCTGSSDGVGVKGLSF